MATTSLRRHRLPWAPVSPAAPTARLPVLHPHYQTTARRDPALWDAHASDMVSRARAIVSSWIVVVAGVGTVMIRVRVVHLRMRMVLLRRRDDKELL